ncbi:unnamed protein product [Sphagnum jensenii]|uniref:CHAT domain-containing protein n=1 Tax=Sphagnum jensenii TaxID=128206 RepID=A0ABP0W215_9BRYO
MDFLGSGNFFVSGVYNIFEEVAIREHFQNLCAKVGVDCKEHFARARTATETRDWAVAYSEWTSCRNIIAQSEGLLDRDEWLWLLGCQELVSANFWAFHSKNYELALGASIEALIASIDYDNPPEDLSFESYVKPTLWTTIYLWATSDCEEELLDSNVRSVLMKILLHSKEGVPHSEGTTLKEQCKEYVINEWEYVIWEVQKQYFYYFEIDECLRCAREGSKMYGKKNPGKLDYVSKFYEAATLFMAGQSTSVMIEQQTKLGKEWNPLLSEMYSDVHRLWPLKICLVEALEHAENNRLQQLWNQSLMFEESSAAATSGEILKQSFLCAERRVGKAIYFQLAPNMLSVPAMEQLAEFDLKDDVAWNILKTSRAACGPGTVVLEYFVSKTSDVQFVYVMTKEDEVFMQILKIDGLDSILSCLLKWSRESFSEHHNCEWSPINANLEWFYEVLISPVTQFLDDMKVEDKLIIVAPQVLSDVPFAALRKPNSPVGDGYLIQKHTISITPSLRMLHHCNMRLIELDRKGVLDANPGTIVAVGDPVNKSRLPGSAEEVKFIENWFGEKYVKKLVGPEATPAKVLEWAKYPSEKGVKQVIFHIATHGVQEGGKGGLVLSPPIPSLQNDGQRGVHRDEKRIFDDDTAHDEPTPLNVMVDGKEEAQISSCGEIGGIRSGIVVRISKQDPHILKSENISGCGFQWEAHMVVLSTCDSARGQITGEGVLNLPRALMFAGIPSVVASQWKVNDNCTFELMKSFYEQLRSGKDVSSSLRTAMLKMIKKKGKVHEWAPFFACGLPTVCLPPELQAATSSCLCDDSGTSSVTIPKLRLEGQGRNVRMKPVVTISTKRFFQLVNRPGNTCWDCLANLGKYLADLEKELAAEYGIEWKISNSSQEMELRDMGKMIENFANLTAEQQANCIATLDKLGNKHRYLAEKAASW